MLTKKITIAIDNLDKADDKAYCNDAIDGIIDTIFDFPSYVTNISLDKTNAHVYIKFDLGISHTGDMVEILIIEWLSTISQTENKVQTKIKIEEEESKPIWCEIHTEIASIAS